MSQELAAIAPSDYVLGVSSLVHITVCRFETDVENISSIWERVRDIAPSFSLDAKRFYWAPNTGDIFQFTGIEISKPEALLAFQQKLVDVLAPIQVKNPIGPQYFPHFTLGYNDLSQSPNILATMKKESAIWQQPFTFKLVLGVDGAKGKFEKIIYSWGVRLALRLNYPQNKPI